MTKAKKATVREYRGARPCIQPWILERMLRSEARRYLRKLKKEAHKHKLPKTVEEFDRRV